MRGLAWLGVALVLLAGAAVPVLAAPAAGLDTQQQAYLEAATAARDSLDPARPQDLAATRRALNILRVGAPGEVDAIHLLESQPPQTIPARARLDSSIAAMDRAIRDPDPQATETQLSRIMAQSRYHPDQGPMAFIGNLLIQFLNWIFRPAGGVLGWAFILLLLGVVLVVVLLLVPALRGPLRRGRDDRIDAAAGLGAVPEYFRVADGLAAKGDFAGAVRALAAGTMEMISGERSFTASPLTVRETFNRSGGARALRPLLLGFERSYYGHRETRREDYDEAAAAAHAYRELAAQARVAA
ncbi:MAG: hypothetical protein QOK05_2614 [Chloroflexota bacterium]|nr:hypothetical protein [Chloroflexota bacterium]